MNCKIVVTPEFARELKRLAKRYPSIKEDYANFLVELRENPTMGKELGKHLRKVRFSVTSKGKGKSGGARVITHTLIAEINDTIINLVIIYDKSDRENITDRELKKLIKKNGLG